MKFYFFDRSGAVLFFVPIEIYLGGSGGLYPSIWYLKNVAFSGGIYQKRLDSSRARGYNIGMLSLTLTLLLQLTTQQQELVDAIIMVESSGNDEAVGDNGNAIGCLQIWKIYHTDAIERSDIGGSYKDCYDRAYAIKVFDAYMRRYAREAWTDPRQFNAERVARIHNGGPRGYRKQATQKYWKKVLTELSR